MKKKKNGGMVSITAEMMESILNLPEGVHITEVLWDERDIVSFKFRSEEPVEGVTVPVCEGMNYPVVNGTDLILRKMIDYALDFENIITSGPEHNKELVKQILDERKEQEES